MPRKAKGPNQGKRKPLVDSLSLKKHHWCQYVASKLSSSLNEEETNWNEEETNWNEEE